MYLNYKFQLQNYEVKSSNTSAIFHLKWMEIMIATEGNLTPIFGSISHSSFKEKTSKYNNDLVDLGKRITMIIEKLWKVWSWNSIFFFSKLIRNTWEWIIKIFSNNCHTPLRVLTIVLSLLFIFGVTFLEKKWSRHEDRWSNYLHQKQQIEGFDWTVLENGSLSFISDQYSPWTSRRLFPLVIF